MQTATEAMLKCNEKERQAQIFEHMIEAFLKRHKPNDRYDAAEFERELFMLVRQIYQDAQAPLLDTITKIAMAAPLPSGAGREK